MAKRSTTTATPDIIAENVAARYLGELQPVKCEYIAADEVLVTLQGTNGDVFTFSTRAGMLVHGINLAVALVNNSSSQVFRDLGVF